MEKFAYLQGLNSSQQTTIAGAQALRKRLEADGFSVTSLFCLPMGYGSQTGLTESDLASMGVPADLPINLFFDFQGGDGSSLVALVNQMFDGSVEGYRRLYASIYPRNPLGWIDQLLNLPEIQAGIKAAL
jgi:hypothetical protein